MKQFSIIAIILLTTLFVSCGSDGPGDINAFNVLFKMGTLGNKLNHDNLRPGDKINSSSTIFTGPASLSDIASDDNVVKIRFYENAVYNLSRVKKDYTLTGAKGKILLALKKLSWNSDFLVKTPSSVIAVRGTSFMVDFQDGSTRITVAQGKVLVKNKGERKEVVLTRKKSVAIDEKGKMSPVVYITEESLKELEVNLKNLTEEVSAEKKKNPVNPPSIEPVLKTNEEIYAYYGKKFDVFEIKKGGRIYGAIIGETPGKEWVVHTINGIKTISYNDGVPLGNDEAKKILK